MATTTITTFNVLKKLRTKTIPTLRKFGITHFRRFIFANTSQNQIDCSVDNDGIRIDVIETQIINYGKLLEDYFQVAVNYNSTDKKLIIDNITINFYLQTERVYPGNFLQPKYFSLSGNFISYSSYTKEVVESIESDNLMTRDEKNYLKSVISNTSHTVPSAITKFNKKFIDKVATNFSEILGPLLLLEELIDQEIIESTSQVSIKFPSSQNAKHDYEILNRKELGSNTWLISVKGGVAASVSSLQGKVNVIKFNTIFDNESKVDEKRYGVIQTIVAKNIIKHDRINGPIKAVIEILNLFNNRSKVDEIIDGLFASTINRSISNDDKKYVINYLKNLSNYNKNNKITDEKIIEYLQNIKSTHTGTYEELSFACERAITIQSSGQYRFKNSNYKKFVYDYLKNNTILVQQIAITRSNLQVKSEVKTFEKLKNWYFLRSKNSPGHVRDKIGIDPIGR